MHMCAGAVHGAGGSGLLWVPAPAGSLLSQGLCRGVCRGFLGCMGERALLEVCAATDTYVYQHAQIHVGDACE